MRRLNRAEYDNSIRDLTGLDLHLSENFPSDDVGYGFDNIGDVLSLSPLLMEKYLSAAETVSRRLILSATRPPARFDASNLQSDGAATPQDNGLFFFSVGTAYTDFNFPASARYHVKVSAGGEQAGPEPVKMALTLDGNEVQQVDVPNAISQPKVYEFDISVDSGHHKLGVKFLNDYYRPGPPPQDRNMSVQSLEIISPSMTYQNLPETHRRVVFIKPTPENRHEVTRKVLGRFASRAFRRPVTDVELDRLCQIAALVEKDKQPIERSLQIGIQAILCSPNFLFRVERDTRDGKLGSYEIASRLSYFIWNSTPDDRLLELASKDALTNPVTLAKEAKRLLADPRSHTLGENFASQWLNLRKLNTSQPDPKQFPEFNEKLRAAMFTETRMFFESVVREDRSIIDFIGGKYSYVNEDLASLYGIPNVKGEGFQKVSLVGLPRSGFLTQASILTLTSNPTRTSPVKRGKWILDQLLNQPPPPPPPNVPDLKDEKHITGATLRIRMEQHRKDPICSSCHVRMDPLGFSLENFDATGKWRTEDSGAKIDNSGVLPDGTAFAGPDELRGILLKKQPEFVRCVSEKLLTYALGRGVEGSDRCYVDDIAKRVQKGGNRFSSLVVAIVESEPFRSRRPNPAGTKAPARPSTSNRSTRVKGKKA